MNTNMGVNEELGRLEANAGQLLTAIQWLTSSLEKEAAQGHSLGWAMAVQMGGPVKALSNALLNLNYGVSELLAAAQADLREQAAAGEGSVGSFDVATMDPPSVMMQ
jgi:hypothetical protein